MNIERNKPIQAQDRRKFFLTVARAAGLAMLGGLTWSAYGDEVKATSLILGPPAALDEDDVG
ncbi:ferredoxin-type protein NapG, partial [Aliarcobacter butzleri]